MSRDLESRFPGLAAAVRKGHEMGLSAWEIVERLGSPPGLHVMHVNWMRAKLGLRMSAKAVEAAQLRTSRQWWKRRDKEMENERKAREETQS